MTGPGGLTASVVAINTVTGEVMPAGDRAGWTDDEWYTYIRAADPGEAIKARAVRIYEYAHECPRCQGGSHFSRFMRERFGMAPPESSRQKLLGRELLDNAQKFSPIQISDDARAWEEVAAADDEIIHKLADEGGIVNRRRIKAAKKDARRMAHTSLPDDWQPTQPEIRLIDFRVGAKAIPDDSVDLIFTDPPYGKSTVPLYADAAQEAARILKPGSSMLAYCGQSTLPDVIDAMRDHLRYWWTCAVFHAGNRQFMREYGMIVGWKPLVWFVKGTRGDRDHNLLDVVSGGTEKDAHEWQQAESEAFYYVQELTRPGDLVVDFFCGGGTTAVACKSLQRRVFTFEIDAGAAAAADARLADDS